MNTLHVNKSILVAILLCTGSTVFAQKSTHATGTIWKKQVAREIDIREKEDEKVHHLRDLSNDTTFLELMMNAVKTGKITAYSNYDHNFTTKLTIPHFIELFSSKPDTVTVTDPVTGTEKMVIVNHDFDPAAIHKYRILEDWTFNRETGNTDIHIAGIAPVKEIFGEDGAFRGVQAMFWIRYNELEPIVARYEQFHPNKSLPSYIWNDYFLSDVKPGVKK